MDLKFYLNKFLKVDNIENYTLKCIMELQKRYDIFLDHSEGVDPDFPLIDFGKNGKKVQGVNKIQAGFGEEESDNNDLFSVNR